MKKEKKQNEMSFNHILCIYRMHAQLMLARKVFNVPLEPHKER